MRDPRLLWSGLTFVAVAVLGSAITIGSLPADAPWMNFMGTRGQMMWSGLGGSGTAGEPIPGATELVSTPASSGSRRRRSR